MPEYYTPGVYFERLDRGGAGLTGLRTDIAGFVGISEKGPVKRAVRVESWKQFQSVFGGFIPQSYLAYSVYGFFENGGDTCYVVRAADMKKAKKSGRKLWNRDGTPVIELSAVNEGRWGDKIKVSARETPTESGGIEYRLTFTFGEDIKEVFKEISIAPAAKRYIAREKDLEEDKKVINGKSNLVEIRDLEPGMAPGDKLLDPEQFSGGALYLEGGVDGISTIRIDDITGDSDSEEKRGLMCLEDVDEVSIVSIPDIMVRCDFSPPAYAPPPEKEETDPCLHPDKGESPDEDFIPYEPPSGFEEPPVFSEEDIAIVQQRIIEHCEAMKDRVAVLDPPFGADAMEIQKWRKRFDSKYAALYYPWIRVDDPLRLNGRITRLIPPGGYMAGIYARNDRLKGVHKAPANEEVLGAKDVELLIEGGVQEILNPMGINCIRVFPGRGIMVWGARTISSDTSWRFINVRRLLIMIEESVEAAMQWAVFEPNDFHLRMGIRVSVSSFLEELWRRGALSGSVGEGEAFIVKCDEDNNPQNVIDAGKLVAEIRVAPSFPGEFIVFRIGRVDNRFKIIEES